MEREQLAVSLIDSGGSASSFSDSASSSSGFSGLVVSSVGIEDLHTSLWVISRGLKVSSKHADPFVVVSTCPRVRIDKIFDS